MKNSNLLLVVLVVSAVGCGADVGDSSVPVLNVTGASADALSASAQVGAESVSVDVKTETTSAVDDETGAAVSERRLHLTVTGRSGDVYAETFTDLDADGTREDMVGTIGGLSFGKPGDSLTDDDAGHWASVKSGRTGDVLAAVAAAADRAQRSGRWAQADGALGVTSQLGQLFDRLGGDPSKAVGSELAETGQALAYVGTLSIHWYTTLLTAGWSAKMVDDRSKTRKVGVKLYERNNYDSFGYESTNHYGNGSASVSTQLHGWEGQAKGWWAGTSYALWTEVYIANN